jgi:glycosyltransferase involved in cell wall biosynthesis
VFALQLARHLSAQYDFMGLTNRGTDIPEYKIRKIIFSKTLVSRSLRQAVNDFSPGIIIYVPQASVTTNSFIRAWLLTRAFPSARVAMIGLQPRPHAALARWLIGRIGPEYLFVQDKASLEYFAKVGLSPRLVLSGVDTNKFRPVDSCQKSRLRKKHGIEQDVFLISHVGHLRTSRNLELLKSVSRRERTHMLMVASSYSGQDMAIRACLLSGGVDVRSGYIEQVEEIYQMSDVYLFPVINKCGAIEMPLSVLEALACGTPVISTPFGALKNELSAISAVYFIRDKNDLEEAIVEIEGGGDPDVARETALRYSWKSVFEQFLICLLLK